MRYEVLIIEKDSKQSSVAIVLLKGASKRNVVVRKCIGKQFHHLQEKQTYQEDHYRKRKGLNIVHLRIEKTFQGGRCFISDRYFNNSEAS